MRLVLFDPNWIDVYFSNKQVTAKDQMKLIKAVKSVIKNLPPHLQYVVRQRLKGHRLVDICTKAGWSKDSGKVLWYRAKKKIKELLENNAEFQRLIQ